MTWCLVCTTTSIHPSLPALGINTLPAPTLDWDQAVLLNSSLRFVLNPSDSENWRDFSKCCVAGEIWVLVILRIVLFL